MKKYVMKVMMVTMMALGCAALAAPASAHKGATGIVKERMDAFQTSQHHLRGAVAAAKRGDFDEVARLARLLAVWGAAMPDYFPAGSDAHPSEAAPAIWTDFSGFAAAAAAYSAASRNLGDAALSGDGAAVRAALGQTSAACKACHQRYRLD